jgi:hypothetical protein
MLTSVFDVQGEVIELRTKSEQLAGELAAQGVELSRVNEEQAQQTRLLKSLQRKLQLVTAERDSYKVRAEFPTEFLTYIEVLRYAISRPLW